MAIHDAQGDDVDALMRECRQHLSEPAWLVLQENRELIASLHRNPLLVVIRRDVTGTIARLL